MDESQVSPLLMRTLSQVLGGRDLDPDKVDMERLRNVVLNCLSESASQDSGKDSPGPSDSASASQPFSASQPSSSKSRKEGRVNHSFSHRTLQMVRKASGTSLLRNNSDSSLCGGNLCSDKSEKKQNKLLRQRGEQRRRKREALADSVTPLSLAGLTCEDEMRARLEAEAARVLLTSDSSEVVRLAFLSVTASLQAHFRLSTFSSNVDAAVRDFLKRHWTTKLLPREDGRGSGLEDVERELRWRQLSVLLTLGGLSEPPLSRGKKLPLCEASLNWLLDELGWMMAAGDGERARAFLDSAVVEEFVELIPRHLARLILELGRRLPIELASLEDEGEEVEDAIFPSPLKGTSHLHIRRSSFGEPAPKKRRKDSVGSPPATPMSPPSSPPLRLNGSHSRSHSSHSRRSSAHPLSHPSRNQKILLDRLKIDMCPPGKGRRKEEERRRAKAEARSAGRRLVLKRKVEVPESPADKQASQSELRRRRRELSQKQLERLRIEESPQGMRISPRDHASTKAILARKRSLSHALSTVRGSPKKLLQPPLLASASAKPPRSTSKPKPLANLQKRRSRDSFLGLKVTVSPPPSTQSSTSSRAQTTPTSPATSSLASPQAASSPRKTAKRNLSEALNTQLSPVLSLPSPAKAVEPALEEEVVSRYRRLVEELRKEKRSGKLEEEEIFYAKAGRVRKNVFEEEAESDRPVSTRLHAAKAKNRSGRAVRAPELAHASHFLLNSDNPNPTAPVLPRVLLHKLGIHSPFKLPKMKQKMRKPQSPSKARRRLLGKASKSTGDLSGLAESPAPLPASARSRKSLDGAPGVLREGSADSGLEARLASLSDSNGAPEPPPGKVEEEAAEAAEEAGTPEGSLGGWERGQLEGLLSPRTNGWRKAELRAEGRAERSRSLSDSDSSLRRSPRTRNIFEALGLPPASPKAAKGPANGLNGLNGFHHPATVEEDASHASWQDEDSIHV